MCADLSGVFALSPVLVAVVVVVVVGGFGAGLLVRLGVDVRGLCLLFMYREGITIVLGFFESAFGSGFSVSPLDVFRGSVLMLCMFSRE